jgi:hypothetical protein
MTIIFVLGYGFVRDLLPAQSDYTRYRPKTPYRDGITHVIFELLDFIARLAALVPQLRLNLTCYHGVFARNSKYRALLTPAKRGKGSKSRIADQTRERTPTKHRSSMS